MKFGKKLQEDRNPEWKDSYIAYNDLKSKIKVIVNKKTRGSISVESSQDLFLKSLDEELKKVVDFYLEKETEFSEKLNKLSVPIGSDLNRESLSVADEIAEAYREIGLELVELYRFIELNATSLRKILKKYDKQTFNSVTEDYVNSRISDPKFGLYIYQGTAMKELSDDIKRKLNLLHTLYPDPDFLEADESPRGIIHALENAEIRVKEASQFMNLFAMQAGFERGQYVESKTSQEYPYVSLFLNIFSVFLFMTNYYIVVPTTAAYAKRLHTRESFGSLILGVCAVASLLSAVVFSWWTNFAYRTPMIFSSFAIAVGNILYALADYYGSMYIVLLSRVVIGLGASRGLNRRYINDVVRLRDRTRHCAYFVAASTLGMASGPALASVLSGVDFHIFGLHVDQVTAPGWLMAFCWMIFIGFALVYFEDPENIKLADIHKKSLHDMNQDRKYQTLSSPSSPSPSRSPHKITSSHHPCPSPDTVPFKFSWTTFSPLFVCLFFYTVLKIFQDAFQASTPIACFLYFNWGPAQCGIFLGLLGLSVLPLNIFVGWLSRNFQDRQLILATQILTFIGMFLLINFGELHHMSFYQYFSGSIFFFFSVQILEGVTMSLISKVIPPALATGFWNAGFLTTEAGTFGRALGDFVVAFSGLEGKRMVENFTFIPMSCIALIAVIVCLLNFSKLVPLTDDENEKKPFLPSKSSPV